MRTLKLDTLSFIASPNEKKFILLRSKKADNLEFLESSVVPKIVNRNEAYKIPGVWGTLGYANNNPIDWDGKLECSNEGNDDFEENSTVEEKDKVRNFQPPIDGKVIMETFDIKPCSEIGTIKNKIKEAILEGQIKNDYDEAYQMMLKLGEELGLKR